LASLAVTQAIALETEAQAPAFDVDVHMARLGLFVEALKRPDFQRSVAQ
jgi:hypothetical protein